MLFEYGIFNLTKKITFSFKLNQKNVEKSLWIEIYTSRYLMFWTKMSVTNQKLLMTIIQNKNSLSLPI